MSTRTMGWDNYNGHTFDVSVACSSTTPTHGAAVTVSADVDIYIAYHTHSSNTKVAWRWYAAGTWSGWTEVTVNVQQEASQSPKSYNAGNPTFSFTPTAQTTAITIEAKVWNLAWPGTSYVAIVQNTEYVTALFAPEPPTTVAATAPGSGTSTTVSWTMPSESGSGQVHQWSTAYVERWDNVSNAWSSLTAVSATYTSVVDSTISLDRQYKYRVKGSNSVGTSSTTESSSIYTLATTPSNLVATRDGTHIDLTWANASTIDTGVVITRSANLGAYTELATVNSPNQVSYVDTPAGDVTKVQYKVAVVYPSGTTVYTTSNLVDVLQNPAAPTLLTNYSSEIIDIADTAEPAVTWAHVPLDGTAQTYWELEYKTDSGDWTATGGKTAGATSTFSFASTYAVENEHTISWRVRTWGSYEHGTPDDAFSPWSETGLFITKAKPTVAITTPTNNYDLDSMSLSVTHEFTDATETQASHKTLLYSSADVLLWQLEEADTNTTTAVTYAISNNTTYKVGKKVKNESGLWSTEDIHTVNIRFYEGPGAPDPPTSITVVFTAYNDIEVSWEAPASATGLEKTWTNVIVQRWDSVSSVWATLATITTDESGSYLDEATEVNRQYEYRVRASNVWGSTSKYSAFTTLSGYVFTDPAAPVLTSVAQPQQVVRLNWTIEAEYPTLTEIERKAEDGDYVAIATLSDSYTNYEDSGAAPETSYTYRIRSTSTDGTLFSEWVVSSPIVTKEIQGVESLGINIPPVRRNGCRESIKENITIAEITTLAIMIDEHVTNLTGSITTLSTMISDHITNISAGDEAVIAQSELRK